VKGNLWIISTRANQIKNDATPEELMKVALGVQDEVARRGRPPQLAFSQSLANADV
jgi:hypothetical protein